MTRLWRFAYLIIAAACSSGPAHEPASCVEGLDLSCTPAYEPTFEAIYQNLLSKSCGSAATGGVCHYAPSGDNSLQISDLEGSYENLLGMQDGRAHVVPTDPACSAIVARIESNDPGFRMPVGRAALSAGERCAVRRWIAEGAKR